MSRKQLGWLLFGLFFLALLMGPGPGIYLINPDPNDPEATRFFLGLPIVYVWAAFWFGVEAAVVAAAYFKLWRHEGETEGEGSES